MENLERNFNQSRWILCGDTECVCMNFPSPPSFFMKTQCIVKNVSNLSHSTTQTVVLFSVKTMRNNCDTSTSRNKFAQYKVKSRHYKRLLLITEAF